MPTGGNLSQPMDPIPIPQPTPTSAVRTPQDVGLGVGKDDPPVTNYQGGRAGGVAHIADKLLTGWMAGKKVGEDRARNKAADLIGSSKAAVDTIGQSYRSAVESGDEGKIKETKRALTAAWTNYVGLAEKYVAPPEGQKKGIGKKIKDAVVPHGPEMYQAASLDLLKKTDPSSLYGPSKEDELRLQKEKSLAEEAGQRKQINDLNIEEQKAVTASRDEYFKALGSGDMSQADAAARKFEAFGGKIDGLPSRQKLDEEYTKAALSGVEAINSGKQFGQLNQMQQSAMVKEGLGPQIKTGLQAYLTQVGPGKEFRFKNEYEAAEKYNRDVTANRIMGQKPTPLEELRESSRVILQHKLQDPAEAKKYGLSSPLKAGEKPPAWAIEQDAEERYKHSPMDSADANLVKEKSVNNIVNKSLGTMSPSEQATAKQYFLSTDPDTRMQSLNPFPDMSKVPEEQRDQVMAVGKALRQRAGKWMKMLYPDADEKIINERLGPDPSFDKGMTEMPNTAEKGWFQKAKDAAGDWLMPGKKPEMSAPPSGDSKVSEMTAPPGNYKPGNYKLSKDGKSAHGGEAVELSADEAKKLAGQGWSLEEVQ